MIQLFKISLIVFFSLSSGWALAKEKTGSTKSGAEEIVWMNGEEVSALLPLGAFWCMEPERDTCTFYSQSTQGLDVVYRVVNLWTESIVIEETIDAHITPDGKICEVNSLNLKRIYFTDLRGNPVDTETLAEARNELRDYYEQDKDLDICFAYTHTGSDDPNIILQYYIDETGAYVDPIPFSVDYSSNAENNYLLRWEE